MKSNLVQKLIEIQDSDTYKQGMDAESDALHAILRPLLFNTDDCIENYDPVVRVMFYCMRDDPVIASYYRYYSERKTGYLDYKRADEFALRSVSKNRARIVLNKRFSLKYSLKQMTSCFKQLVDSNLLIAVEHVYLVNLPYIVRAATNFELYNADTNNTNKQKEQT